jgi:hypothetical protein
LGSSIVVVLNKNVTNVSIANDTLNKKATKTALLFCDWLTIVASFVIGSTHFTLHYPNK